MAVRVIVIVLGALLLFQLILRIVRKTIHFPAPPFIGRFLDSGFRRALQPPERVIARSGIQSGMTVLELGCGSGAFTPFVARALGSKGRLYALDIQPEMLNQLTRKLAAPDFADIKNVIPTLRSAYDTRFESALFDVVYLVTVFQEIPEKEKALREVRRVLKPEGALSITEFLVDPDYPLKGTTVRQVTQAGFLLEEVAGSFWNYTIRFRNP